MSGQNIILDDVMKLLILFKEKNWIYFPNQETVFENFCILLNNLTQEQKELIHELSANYLWITASEYNERFNSLLSNIDLNKLEGCKTIYIFPIIEPKDENKIKSGDHCAYLLKGIFPLNRNYTGITIKFITNFEDFKNIEFKQDGTELMFFIDDFIGTGDTFAKAWIEIEKNQTLQKENL